MMENNRQVIPNLRAVAPWWAMKVLQVERQIISKNYDCSRGLKFNSYLKLNL